MRNQLKACVLILALALCARTDFADDKSRPAEPKVRLGELSHIELAPRTTPAIQPAHIKQLIASLATLDKPDIGLSATLSGSTFAPVPDLAKADMMLLTDHHLETSDALKELVSIGPDALPLLLDALDDQTPTKITIDHKSDFGGMWFDREVAFNPVNGNETGVLPRTEGRDDGNADFPKNIDSYTLKIGDVCFVAIGQIVGRPYEAIRYQASVCVVVSSPAHDPQFCAQVRKFWRSDNPRQKLFDSLKMDYATAGIFNGENLNGWYLGNEFQCSAATRLLYYFPQEFATLIAGRIDRLDLSNDVELDGFMKRCVANGVRSDDFLKAVAWSSNDKIRAALVAAFKRAGDINSLLAASAAVDDKAVLAEKFGAVIDGLPADDPVGGADVGAMLSTLATRTPDAAKPAFVRYLKTGSTNRCRLVCAALGGVKVSWDVDLLRPMLSDVRSYGWTYAVVEGVDEPRLPIRICDDAAAALAANHPELKFKRAGTHAVLDGQIAAMRAKLAPATRP